MQLIATAINIAIQTVLLARVTHRYTATPNTLSQSERRTSYDVVMAGKSRRVVPDGIVAHRNAVRQRGGLIAVALSLGVLVVGLVLLALPGSLTGLLGFVLTFIALPTMPLFGIPASGGFTLYALSFFSSVLLWWIIGHYASIRAIREIIASWPEWRREFRPLAIGLVLGSLISLALAALILGAL